MPPPRWRPTPAHVRRSDVRVGATNALIPPPLGGGWTLAERAAGWGGPSPPGSCSLSLRTRHPPPAGALHNNPGNQIGCCADAGVLVQTSICTKTYLFGLGGIWIHG